LATERVEAERIVSEAGIYLAAVAETGMPSEGDPGDITDPTLAAAAAGAPPAWGLEAEAVASVAVEVGVDGAGSSSRFRNGNHRSRG
jgi:hypothetical protein